MQSAGLTARNLCLLLLLYKQPLLFKWNLLSFFPPPPPPPSERRVILKNVRADDPDLSIRFWNAFYQFALAGKFGDYKYLSRLPEDLVQKSRQKSQSSALDVSISNSQNEVYEVLRDAGLCVRPEALVFEDCFSVDILYEPTGADVDPQSPTCIAIEVDGPTHYRADDTR